jgi:hypothetical protein
VTVQEPGGIVVGHSFVEKLTLNASDGANAITVLDSNPTNSNYTASPGGSTSIKLVDSLGASTLAVNDADDVANNNWTITNSQVTRTSPTPALTVDYSTQTTITNLSLAGGSAIETVNVNSTKVATSVAGNAANDVFNVGNGDLDNLAGQVTIGGATWKVPRRGPSSAAAA